MIISNDISNDPRYTAMTYDTAVYICHRFVAEFGDCDPLEVEQAPEGQTAMSLYALALGWLVYEGRWQEAGIDPEFVSDLGGGR